MAESRPQQKSVSLLHILQVGYHKSATVNLSEVVRGIVLLNLLETLFPPKILVFNCCSLIDRSYVIIAITLIVSNVIYIFLFLFSSMDSALH